MIIIKVIKPFFSFLAILIFFTNTAFSENLKQGSSDERFQSASKRSSKHHSRHKSKKSTNKTDQNSNGSQEEVTDQREVSQQSDHSAVKKK